MKKARTFLQQLKPLITSCGLAAAMFAGGFSLGSAHASSVALRGAKVGRRSFVNTATTFGAINLYTQLFERLGVNPVSVIAAGATTVAIGLWLWHYNKSKIARD